MLFALALGSGICALSTFLIRTLTGELEGPRLLSLLGLGLAMLIFVGAAAYAGRNVHRVFEPLDSLLEASQRVADGDTDVQVVERGVREVRALIRAFNQMVRELNEQRRGRRDILADVTHELRTPLTVIQGGIEGMIDQVYPRDDSHLQDLLIETQRMSAVIEDLRTLSLADRSALMLRKEPTDLTQLVSETLSSFRAQAASNGIELELVSAEQPIVLQVDPMRIGQVFSNLLTNALRYTGEGDSVEVVIQRSNSGQAIIEINDSGTGIQPEDLPHIFDRFYRSSDSSGSGLGLAIAKQIVEAHGGNVRAESAYGEWTRLRVELPIQTDGV